MLIAENVSIRDGEHRTKKNLRIIFQDDLSESIEIGEDVWIGAGCIILKGSTLKEGCVVGANSLVTKNSAIEPFGIYAGSPVQLIGYRI